MDPVPKRLTSAVDRLRQRMADRLDEDHDKPLALRRTQVRLAEHIGIKKSALNELLHGQSAQQGLLARLDKIAEYLDMSPAELVKAETSTLMELSVAEQRIIRQWREWPREVRATVLRLFDYFGALLPEEQEAREYGYLLRQIKDSDLRARMVGSLRDTVKTQPRKFGPTALTSDADTNRTVDTPRSMIARRNQAEK